MRLSEMAKASVRPRDFWIAIAIVVVLLCGIGTYVMKGGRDSHIDPWILGGLLLLFWIVPLYQVIRYGWRVITGCRAAILVGSTLFFGEKLWSHPPALVSWASWLGTILLVFGVLFPYFDFSQRHSNRSNIRTP